MFLLSFTLLGLDEVFQLRDARSCETGNFSKPFAVSAKAVLHTTDFLHVKVEKTGGRELSVAVRLLRLVLEVLEDFLCFRQVQPLT